MEADRMVNCLFTARKLRPSARSFSRTEGNENDPFSDYLRLYKQSISKPPLIIMRS